MRQLLSERQFRTAIGEYFRPNLGRSDNRGEAEAEHRSRLAIVSFAMIVRAKCNDIVGAVGAPFVQRHDMVCLKIDGAVCLAKARFITVLAAPPGALEHRLADLGFTDEN